MIMLRRAMMVGMVVAMAPLAMACGGVALTPVGEEPTDGAVKTAPPAPEGDGAATTDPTGPGEPTAPIESDGGTVDKGSDGGVVVEPGTDAGKGPPFDFDAGLPGFFDGGGHHHDGGGGGMMGFDAGGGGMMGFDAGGHIGPPGFDGG